MIGAPETAYARSGDVHIAYQVVGEGPVDLLYTPGLWSNVELMWEHPPWARFLERLASFSRLVLFDMRGVGLSDRGSEPPYLELQRDDIGAVMDAVEIDSGIVFAGARAASMALMFGATNPERTEALILYAPVAKTVSTPDFPYGLRTVDEQDAFMERFVREVGTGRNLALQAPTVADDAEFRRWWARFERLVASPGAYRELATIFTSVDVRDVLPAIHVPTLVLQRSDDAIVRAVAARYVAESIDGARYVELPGRDHVPFVGDADALVDEVQEFVTGSRPAPEVERLLATLMFTDIVDSTRMQAQLGDRGWKQLIERHNEVVRKLLARFGGLEQDTAGDGFFVRFDGPARAIRCAQEMAAAVRVLGLQTRTGIHTGECELAEGKCSGLSVSIAARILSSAGPSEVLVSQTVKDLVVGSGITFDDRGEHELKGVPGPWKLYAVAGAEGRG